MPADRRSAGVAVRDTAPDRAPRTIAESDSGRHRRRDLAGHGGRLRPETRRRPRAVSVLPGHWARPARGVLVGGLATAAVVVMAGSIGVVLTSPVDRPPVLVSPASEAPAAPGPTPLDVRTSTVAARATALTIPDLGVRSGLVDLGVDEAGALEVPADAAVPGWFTAGALPGELGPTVIAGHVDSKSGPGVFYRLADLAVGAEVEVGRSDGGSARYRVTDVLTVLKSAFPTDRVYGPTSGAELRLITCGGEFDRSTGHYVRNIVASATLVDEA